MHLGNKLTGAALAVGLVAIGSTASGAIHDMSWSVNNGGAVSPLEYGTVQDNGNGSNLWSIALGGDGGPMPIQFGDFRLDDYSCTTFIQSAPGPLNSAFIDAAFEVTNTGNTTQTFSLLMTLGGTGFIGPVTTMDGSVAATVTNNQFGGDATLGAPISGSIYRAFTDLSDPFSDPPAATLMDDPFSIVASGPFASADDNQSFLPTGGPTVNNTISIMFEFTLSAGDSASVSGLFQIAAVPAPGALALLGVAGLAGTRRRRRC